ncbi:low-density lipoprotein receptor-related protein 2-like [Drosophila ficusphila]|uniref:low-density lipoprotein receptor-related protein 2-like n=1 Tax=Drosophila ficusphila TaxID=30025 RepID=UPI0007E6F7F5|nr:low-density lipoprotein receptor-related protein 2-like [Drosophila ficusphila]
MSSPGLQWSSLGLLTFCLLLCVGSPESCDEGEEFQCQEDGSCIPFENWCNTKPDCPLASDESFISCKTHPSDMMADKFQCANGAPIPERLVCNDIVDCSDGSDELPQVCNDNPDEMRQRFRGNCTGDSDLECLPGECVADSAKCNGVIDCSNGRDESLEICMQSCDKNKCFQCSNGVLVDSKHLCDNEMHCLDGSDELLTVCGNAKNWTEVPPAECYETSELLFTNRTVFQMKDSRRFVYANQPAEVQCWNSDRRSWNVCMNNGSWHHEFPPCHEKLINRNPDTNGTNGCPINWYNNETMIIWDENDNSVMPPIQDSRVTFKCEDGLTFLPYEFKDDPITCLPNNTWIEKDFHPRCTKLCSPDAITEMYSLTPRCYNGENGTPFNCKDKYSLIPETRVKFECASGFTHRTSEPMMVKCTEEGRWEGLRDLCEREEKLCNYECNHRLNYSEITFSKGGDPTDSLRASWLVPIYRWNSTTAKHEFACTGNLIRLDIVLTAAHCIKANGSQKEDFLVGPTGNRSDLTIDREHLHKVRHLDVYGAYSEVTHTYDVGIIFLEKRMDFRQDQRIVCLPYSDGSQLSSSGDAMVTSWNSDGYLTTVYGRLSELRNGDLNVELNDDYRLCKGDSGSGVITTCGLDNHKCLVAVISRNVGSGDHGTFCSNNVTAASLKPLPLQDHIQQIIRNNVNCPEVE